ncbi:MAG: zinc ribbon domain-containing protein [Oscillospiraceae bacterium]|nr:zinc ribbon domain-containing protein [Oscillospiraceae bacterium]
MFCHKCGIKLSDNAAFCTKCGIKISSTDIHHNDLNTYTQQAAVVYPQEFAAKNNYDYDKSDFKQFMNNHIQATTEFQSAEELLNSQLPLWKAWLFPAIPALLLGVLIGETAKSEEIDKLSAYVIWSLFFYFIFLTITYFVVWIKRNQYITKFSGKFNNDIKIDEIIAFLDENLNYLSPYFDKWGVLTQSGFNALSQFQASMETYLSERHNEIRLCTEFGIKTNLLAILYLRPDINDSNSGTKEYFVDVKPKISFGMQFSTYTCVYKSAPILQAAMKYYFQYYAVQATST